MTRSSTSVYDDKNILDAVYVCVKMPVTAAERFKARTVFARSEAGVVASNPTQGMDV
jgi:hypothetical protein